MTRYQSEIRVCRQQFEIVPNGQLGQERINSRYLNTFLSAGCLQDCGLDVISKIGNNVR